MGVYIKGMTMPESCYECDFAYQDQDSEHNVEWICAALHRNAQMYERREDCPLISVPPHGRCVDADALVNKHFGKEFLSKVMTANEDDLRTALINVPLVINNTQTIIPAEEEKNEVRLYRRILC